jgi:hypothetical protein
MSGPMRRLEARSAARIGQRTSDRPRGARQFAPAGNTSKAMRGRAGNHPVVGRDHELALVQRAVTRAAAGQPGVVLVSGDPGIGKSTLLSEAARLTGTQLYLGRGVHVDGEANPLAPPDQPSCPVPAVTVPIGCESAETGAESSARRRAAGKRTWFSLWTCRWVSNSKVSSRAYSVR